MTDIKKCAFCGTPAHKFKTEMGRDVVECLNKKCGAKCDDIKKWNDLPRELYTGRPLPDMYNRHVENALNNLSKSIKNLEYKLDFYRIEKINREQEKLKHEKFWNEVFLGVLLIMAFLVGFLLGLWAKFNI